MKLPYPDTAFDSNSNFDFANQTLPPQEKKEIKDQPSSNLHAKDYIQLNQAFWTSFSGIRRSGRSNASTVKKATEQGNNSYCLAAS